MKSSISGLKMGDRVTVTGCAIGANADTSTIEIKVENKEDWKSLSECFQEINMPPVKNPLKNTGKIKKLEFNRGYERECGCKVVVSDPDGVSHAVCLQHSTYPRDTPYIEFLRIENEYLKEQVKVLEKEPTVQEICEWEQKFCNLTIDLMKACMEEGRKNGLMGNVVSFRTALHEHVKDKLKQPEGTYLKVVVTDMENFNGRDIATVEYLYKGTPSVMQVDAFQLVRTEPIKNITEEPCLKCGKVGIGHGYCKDCLEAENE